MNEREKYIDKARKLAAAPYHIQFDRETHEDGHETFVLRLLEIPQCIVEADTLAEGISELKEVAIEMIALWLEHGVQIPAPYSDGDSRSDYRYSTVSVTLPNSGVNLRVDEVTNEPNSPSEQERNFEPELIEPGIYMVS